MYVQYSFPNFKARVESGLAFWEAVKGHSADSNKKGKKNSSTNEPPSSNVSELDEFGSPASYTPAAQFKGAQATLSQCLLAGQPEDLPLSTRDPTIYIDVDGTYKVQYDRAERGLRSVRQNVTAEASVRLVSSSRQDAMVPRSRGTSPGARKTKEKPPKPPKAPEPPKAPAKPKGRPRKFLRGTERFWQGQFAMARMLADPEQYGSSNSRAGVMSDPAGLALFAARPPQFDTTLVRAIESGLPVPTMPQDINQGWVDSMLPILSRDAKGVYITPKGAQLQKLGKHKSASRVFIFRSSRLRELDFSKRTKIPAVRFLTSSAAHSFPDLHTPFFGETGEDSEDEVTPSSPIMIREQDPARELQVVTSEESGSPHERVFHQSPSIASDKMPAAHEADLSTTPATKKPRGRPRKTATIQSSDSVPLPETGSNSLGGKGLHSSESQAIQTYLPNMPPALTTRSALREKKSGIHEVMLGNKASPASSPEALDRSSVLDTTPKTSGPALQTESSAQAESASAPAGPLEAQERSQDASVALATPAGSGLDSRPKIIPAHTTAVEGSENAQIHVISSLQSLPPSTSGPDTAAAGVTANSEIIHTRRAENSVLNLLEVDDHDSEAFKLVQELTADESQQNHGDDEMNPAKNHLQTDSDMASRSADVQNSLPELSIVNDDSDQEPPRKRSKQDGAGAGSIGILRRKIMLDLMETCSGALPYTTNSLWGAFTTAWQKSGQAGKPDMRTIKAVVKSLCQNGSAKQIKFSHRNKKGAMATKTILTKSEMATSDPIILEVQKRMIEADPHSYIPIALDIDPKFKRDVERQALQPWPAVFDDQTVDSSVTPAKVHRLQLRETLSRARRGQSRIGPEAKDADKERESGHVVRRPRLAGIRRKYAKDSDSYQRPKLSTYHYPARPQKSFSNRSAKRSLHFRTEISQAPGTFEDAATQNREPLESQAPFTSLRDGDAEPVDSSRSLSTTPHAQQARSVPIVWKKIGDQPVLPSCLDDILLADRRKKKPDYSKENVPSYREFEWIIDGVSKWECRSLNLFNSKSENWAFINHSVGKDFQPAKDSESRVTFNGLIWYDQRGREHTEKRFHDNALDTLTPRLNNNRSLLHGQPQSASGNTPTKRRFPFDLGERARKRRRGRSPLRQPQTITDSAGNLVDVSHLIGAKYKRPRGTQHLRTMPELLVYKLTVTIVVVRALAGGLEKHVDWPLVMAVFPNEDEQFLRDRWKTLSNKNRREISKLSENFQNRFPDAYARGEIQQIDLDGLENVDWEGIVQWALTNLDKPVMHDIPDLPATKSDFDENINLMIESSSRPYRELFGYNQAVTVPIKEAAISALPFAVPLQSSSSQIPKHPPHLVDPTDETDDPSLTLAKSWALSTIITPLSTFDAAKAHMKLQSLASTATQSETLVKSAMKLLSKSVVKKRDKALDAKGRRYDLSRVFTDTLDQRRTINATTLRQALQYKTTILDPAFGRDERVRFNPVTVEDGDMVAILNLVANGRIRLKVGDDVCRNRWGIDQESRYQTRSIRKESLYFTVLIEQVPESYVFGNPLLEKDVPILELGAKDRDLIPVWRDINGDFQQDFWDLAVAAVLGILATRPGAALREVSKMMNPALEMWEVECLLAWCLELGAVKKTGEEENDEGGWTGGWEVREWWWLILEYGRKEKEGQS